MSLINKMLQDLDARGNQGGTSLQTEIKSVARPERSRRVPLVAGIAAALVAVVAGGAVLWMARSRPAPAPVVVVAKPVARPVVHAVVPAPVPAPAVPSQVVAPAIVPEKPITVEAPPAVVEPVAKAADTEPPTQKPVVAPRRVSASPPTKVDAKKAPKNTVVLKAKPAPLAKLVPTKPAPAKGAAPAPGRQTSAQQRAENDYRRALAGLQDGRVTEAISALEQAVQLDPRHDAARQTLVGLLIENNRKDDAQRVLQNGLTLDPRQPSMAMLLARLHIERGNSGIETLMRTLPYAAGNGEYHAFLAGALQRAERHREAVDQYQAALKSAPQNGIWWMGLGISLQAEKRNAEALNAFQRARDGDKLSPQLLAFIERKLQQLGH